MADENVEEFLEDESLAEKEFHLHNPDVVSETTLRHSATTDTLDSVYLEPTHVEEDVQDIITSIHDLVKEPTDSDSTSGIIEIDTSTQPNDLSEFIAQESSIEMLGQNETGQSQDRKLSEKEMNISSYFTEQNSFEDPFSSSAFVSVSNGDTGKVIDEDIDRNVNRNVEEKVPTAEETSNVHQHLESRLSHEEPESVDFQVDSDVNVMEASLHVIDDKEDFEMFTAENDPGPEFTEYGISPGNSLLADRINQMHLSEYGQNEPDQSGIGGILDRQLSSTSQHSLASTHDNNELGQTPLPASQFSSNQFSPFATPTHQPIPPPSMNIPTNQPSSHPISPTAEKTQIETDIPDTNTDITVKTPPNFVFDIC